MNNLTKSLPALALTSALTFVVAPAADAQSAQGGSSASFGGSTSEETTDSTVTSGAQGQEDLPPLKEWIAGGIAGTYEGAQWFYHQDTKHVVENKEDFEKDIALIDAGKWMTIEVFADKAGYRTRTEADSEAAAPSASGSSLADNAAQVVGLSSSSTLPQAIVGELAGELDGTKWFYNKDINFVVDSLERVNTDVKSGDQGVKLTIDFANELKKSLPVNVIIKEFSSGLGSSGNGALNEGFSNGAAAGNAGSSEAGRLALIALPAVLVIGGISWYLNQDGRTYVENSSRVDTTPSQQEMMSSEQMLSSNRGEVQRQAQLGSSEGFSFGFGQGDGSSANAQRTSGQGDLNLNSAVSAQAVRGMAAETGSNSLAKGLIALLIASVVGTAVFFYGRKQLI